jgi:hypothetical protein
MWANFFNDPIAIQITWNDATEMTDFQYYEPSMNEWVSLPGGSPETLWEVIDDDGTTATLMIYLDNAPNKSQNLKDGGIPLEDAAQVRPYLTLEIPGP